VSHHPQGKIPKILFICKKRNNYGAISTTYRSSGLFNSTRFIAEGLLQSGVSASVVEVDDNNSIDREVTLFRPDIVVIEALWVVPEKFDVLKALHPRVSWFVHLHSQIPFLSMEGIAIQWLVGYAKRRVGVITNALEAYKALGPFLTGTHLHNLPNVYIGEPRRGRLCRNKRFIEVGCFGAIRPLKNQLLQAMAAIRFAKEIHKPLRFHVNSSRVETGGEPVLKNLINLFQNSTAELVHHSWLEPDAFLDLLQDHIDIGMQVSLTETFNVVTADYVTAGVPVVVSEQIPWVSRASMADSGCVDSIVDAMHCARRNRFLVWWNQRLLLRNSASAQSAWHEFVRSVLARRRKS
jgi:hypothetical protein